MCPIRTPKMNDGEELVMAGFNLNDLLNGKSRGTAVQMQEQTAEQESSFDVVMLDVEDLMASKDNFYLTEDIEELAVAIELSGGIEQNLIVKPEAHGKYEVIAGHRRRLAVLKLVAEGKEEYRKVPCRIKKESDEIRDKLALIFTNSTARQLTDWEKIQQAKELKEVLIKYKEILQEENKDKPKAERIKIGRIREIVAQMLNTSITQVGRMESIDNNLSDNFKQELEKCNIGFSTAHELSRLSEEEQENAYKQYERKGKLQIKDVKTEYKPKDEDADERPSAAVPVAAIPVIEPKSEWKQKNKGLMTSSADDKIKVILEDLEDTLRTIFGTKVVIRQKNNQMGEIKIAYYSMDDLDRIIDLLRQ